MIKKKHKLGKMALTITFLLLVIISYKNVYAVEEIEFESTTCEQDYSGDQNAIKKCKQDAKLCFEQLYPNKFSIDTKLSEDKTKLKIIVQSQANKDYTFTIKYEITKDGNKIPQEPKSITVPKNGSSNIEIETLLEQSGTGDNRVSSDIDINITAILDGQIEYKYNDVDCNRKFEATARVKIPGLKVEGFENPDIKEGGICHKYLNTDAGLSVSDIPETGADGTENNYRDLADKYKYSNIKNIDVGNNKTGGQLLQELYGYCFQPTITKRQTKEEIIEGLYYAARSIYAKEKKAGTTTTWTPTPDPKYKYVDSLEKALNLTCDAFSESNTRYFYHNLPEFDGGTVKYHYNYKNPVSQTVCTVQCRELLTITYGPPVAVQAGSCFQYEVKVESKVECNAQEVPNSEPKMSLYQVCEPIPTCWYNQPQYRNQAGPNEEFDSCILEEDGGKYTQKAINKCYKKVYGNNKIKKSNVNLALSYDYNVVKMANTISECGNYDAPGGSNVNNIYNAYRRDGYQAGYYTSSNGGVNVAWHPYGTATYKDTKGREIKTLSGCYWNRYSRFYFLNYNTALRTVGNDGHYSYHWGYGYVDDLSKWKYYPEAGIKVGYAWGTRCNDICGYDTSTCRNGAYYNDVAPKSVAENDPRTSARDQYYKDYKDYVEALEGCKAAAQCSTETSTYKMVVDRLSEETTICEPGNEDSKSCSSWTDANKSKRQCKYNTKNTTDNGVTTQLTGDPNRTFGVPRSALEQCTPVEDEYNSVVREISGVCTEIPGDSQDYRTIIGFPGTWIKSKSLTYRHRKPSNTDDYVFKPNEYCVGTTINTVHKDWYKWDTLEQRSSDTSSVKTTTELDSAGEKITKVDGKYNIRAFIETFGKANWKFNIECFYAACKDKDCNTKTVCTPGDKDCPPGGDTTCKKGECPNPSAYDTKIISLDDLFPTEQSSSGVKNDSLKEIKPSKLNNVKSNENNVLKVENSQKAGRKTGFNWSCDATTLIIPEYPITPTALIAKVQTKYEHAEDVYKDKAEIDFHVKLTPDNIKAIRKDNKNRENNKKDPYITDTEDYSVYQNDKNKIKFYNSTFLTTKNFVSVFEGPQEHTCNNMLNGKCDSYDYKQYISTCDKLGGGE